MPEDLTPTLLYLYMAACCYLIVPLTLNVERLSRMTSQATRSATTIQRLLDSASGTLFIATDAIGRITHYNAGAEQALGYSQEEVLGQSPGMFHTEEETARQAREMGVPNAYLEVVLAMVSSGARRDWEFVRKDGTRRMTSLTLSEVTDPEGGVLGYIGAGEDITERVRAQEALTVALEREHASVQRLVEVDNVKQDLVSNVSHELRTPITSISGYAEVLVDGSLGELNEEQADAVRRIERNTGTARPPGGGPAHPLPGRVGAARPRPRRARPPRGGGRGLRAARGPGPGARARRTARAARGTRGHPR